MKPNSLIVTFIASALFSLTMGACNIFTAPSSGHRTLRGQYNLAQVDGSAKDVYVAGGLVFTGRAFEDTVFTPGGPKPADCVYEVPTGGGDSARVITLSNGTKYLEPHCLPSSYGLVLTLAQASDSTHSGLVSSEGKYVWDGRSLLLENSEGAAWLSGTAEGDTVSLSDGQSRYTFSKVTVHPFH